MNDNVERIQNLIDEYCKSFRAIMMSYDGMVETDGTIQLYVVRSRDIAIDLILYAMIDLDINKKLEVYEKVLHMTSNYERPTVEFNGSYYDLRYADYHDSIIMKIYFFRALSYANLLNRPELYRKILEMGGERHFDQVKILLDVGGLYSDNVECRVQLIDYINKHDEKEDIEL